MSSSFFHQCPSCGHISDISQALAAFIENPHCTQCGLSASESHGKLQDELSLLFDRQMTMTMVPTRADDVVSTSQPTISRNSITQHYHHSSHVVTQAPTSDTRADLVTTQNISDPLCQHGLNPAASSSAQLDLLRNADAAQGQRFIQTWQFYSRPQDSPIQDHEMKDSAVGVAEDHSGNAEPYMISGYEVGVGRSTSTPREPTTGEPYSASTDPVYNSQQWWELPRTVPMESQYGLFEERSRYYTTCGVAQSQ